MSARRERSGSGRRAVVRWAWRLFRREWRQQLLVLALVTVAVGAAVAGTSMAVNAASDTSGQLGDAKAMTRIDGTNPDAARARVAAARQRFGTIEVIGRTSVAVPGSTQRVELRAQDPNGIYGHPMLALRSGRYPTAANEVALTDGAAKLLVAHVGDRIELGGASRSVVGLVENPRDLRDEFALVAAGTGAPADMLTVLLGDVRQRAGPGTSAAGGGDADPFGVIVLGSEKQAVVATVLAATTLAMALVALIASAGFVVVAQRRQRQLGLFAAIGATGRHLRLVMLANGAIVGVVSAIVGGALGVVGWIVASPAVEAAAGHRIGRFDLPWVPIGECLALAVVASTAASWWPARTVARMPVMAALSRRPVRPRPVHRSVALALVLVGGGTGAIAAASPTGDHVRPLVLIAGILAVVIGVVVASPAAVRVLAATASRLPFAPRLALRDLARHQARAAAALAAITLALGISVGVVVVAKAVEPRSDEGNLSNRELVVRIGHRDAPPPVLSTADLAGFEAAAQRIGSVSGGAQLYALDVAMNPSTAGEAQLREPVNVVRAMGPHSFRGFGVPYVATPELLHANGIDPATISAGTELLTSLPGDVFVLDMTVRSDPTGSSRHTEHVDLPTYTSAPKSLITEDAMRAHGWIPARAGWLVESSKPLTTAQLVAVRAVAASAGLTVEARSSQDDLAALRTWATVVGAILALAILAMTIGLIRGESASDLRTLTATGAAARTRRTLTASTAGALALLGVLQATAGAYLALLAGYHADLGKLASPPVSQLLLLAIGMPLIAMAGGWLLAGREPQTFARQTLD